MKKIIFKRKEINRLTIMYHRRYKLYKNKYLKKTNLKVDRSLSAIENAVLESIK